MSTPPNSALRILQVGNVFLDRPIARLQDGMPERRREDLRDAFFQLMRTADELGVSLILFTGNLIDHEYVTNGTVEFLVEMFSERPNMQFVITPGPADYIGETSVYRSGRFPSNVHIIDEEVLSEVELSSLGVTVYGWAFTEKNHRFSPVKHKHARHPEHLILLAGYCECDREDSAFCPISNEDIAAFGAHSAALSSGDGYEGFFRIGNCVVAESGAFECTSFADKQRGGVNLISAESREDGAWQILTKRVPTGEYLYAEEIVDISHLFAESDVSERILARIAEKGYHEKTALRVRLRGSVTPDASFLTLSSAADYGVYMLEIVDETVPTDGTEYLLREMSARGELYRHFYGEMTEGTPESRARAARTFRIGYAALCGKDPLKN